MSVACETYEWRRKRERAAFLAFEDGTVFRGYSVGAAQDRLGEVVFNTGMAGYQEILTDPSYHGQIVTMTYPEIGNYGVTPADAESRSIFLNGFVVHELNEPQNWRSRQSVQAYLREHDIPALAGVDTRALTTKLRSEGTLKAMLCTTGSSTVDEAIDQARAWEGLDGQDYAARVTCTEPYEWDPDGSLSSSWGMLEGPLPDADLRVVAYDFGIKWNIARRLRQQGMAVTIVPAHTPVQDVLNLNPDGVFLSNGPGDPAGVCNAPENIAQLVGKVPLMGICLGQQLLGLAVGGTRFRLKFGHHGCNHPVMDLTTRKVEITSQNHNFAVAADTLPQDRIEITHVNLNDRTVEGLRLKDAPVFAIQFHPEAAPGPHDSAYIFRRFRELILAS